MHHRATVITFIRLETRGTFLLPLGLPNKNSQPERFATGLSFGICSGTGRRMQSFISSGEAEAEEATRFQNALLELKGLRSQLHQAADYCESTFLKTREKNEVVENTKEYICRAMVTVVDHLGSVTSNLESCISQTNAFNEVELRLNCLNQRLFSCEQYARKLEMSRLRWSEILPRYHPRYVSTVSKNGEKSNQRLSVNQYKDSIELPFAKSVGNGRPEISTEKPMPVLLYKFYTYNLSPAKNLSPGFTSNKNDKEKTLGGLQRALLPAGDGLSVRSKGPNSTFHFQVSLSHQKRGRHRKSKLGSDIFSLLKRTKQTA